MLASFWMECETNPKFLSNAIQLLPLANCITNLSPNEEVGPKCQFMVLFINYIEHITHIMFSVIVVRKAYCNEHFGIIFFLE